MYKITIRFYEELNDFLPPKRRKTDFEVKFKNRRSVKDLIESLGVPHSEIDLILVNGKSVGFDYIVKDADRISVYPVFERLDIKHVTRLRPEPLRKTVFIAEENMGSVIRYLRAMGFDVKVDPTLSLKEIIAISNTEKRIILTKNRKLLMHRDVTHAMYVRPGKIEKQVIQIVDQLDIRSKIKPFTRCLVCNSVLMKVKKKDVIEQLPPKVKQHYHEFFTCKLCDKIYWHGSHCERIEGVIRKLMPT